MTKKLKLNIGCGLNAPLGWINIDSSLSARFIRVPWLRWMLVLFHIISSRQANIQWPKNIYFYDVRKGLPFSDNSAGVIYLSHFLEHLSRQNALFFIKESYRVMDTRGIIRIIVPDLVQYAQQYIKNIKEKSKEDLIKEQPSIDFLNNLGIFADEFHVVNSFFRFYKKIVYDKNIHKWVYDEYSLTVLLLKCGFANIQRKRYNESLIEDIEKLDDYARFDNAICLEAQKL